MAENETVSPAVPGATPEPKTPEPAAAPLSPVAETAGGGEPPALSPEEQAAKDKEEADKATEAAKTLNERKQRSSDRIRELTRQKGELERRALLAEERLRDLEKRASERPDPAKYDDPSKYEYDDRAAQAADLRRHEVKLEVEDAAKQAALATVEAWQARCEDFALDVPDFKTVTDNPNIPINASMAQVIMESEDGPAIAYYLGKNPATAGRIASLTPRQQAIELGKIAGRLAAPAPKRVSQAPPPLQPVQGRSGAPTPNIEKMSMEEYARHRHSQLKAERDRRH